MTIPTKSPVTAWLAQFLANRPDAGAADAWRHLTRHAIPLGVPGVEAFDAERKEVLFRTAPHRPLRRIGIDSFMKLVNRTRRRLAATGRKGVGKASPTLAKH